MFKYIQFSNSEIGNALSVHSEPFTAISLKNASALWNFYCSPINVFVLSISGHEQ